MELLPKPKQIEQRQGFYELCWNSVITIGETVGEYGTVYAAILAG